MKYSTDIMKKILTSESAQEIIDFASPIYGESYVGLWWFQVIGNAIDNIRKYVELPEDPNIPNDSIACQALPQTASWGLDYWEARYGLTKDASLDMSDRRQRVLAKMRERAPMNPAKLESIASGASGCNVRIIENTGPNAFTVYVSSLPGKYSKETVKMQIDRAKPAHLIYEIFDEQSVSTDYYLGGLIQMCKKFTIRQV